MGRKARHVCDTQLQYLVWHLTHRGASWASGAAQAAHVVRIILRWFGRLWGSRDGVVVLLVSYRQLALPAFHALRDAYPVTTDVVTRVRRRTINHSRTEAIKRSPR